MQNDITTRREVVPGDTRLPRVETVIFERGRFIGFSDHNTPISQLGPDEIKAFRDLVTAQTVEFIEKRKALDAQLDAREKELRGPALFEVAS